MNKPQIRFKGFEDEWSQGTFGEVCTVYDGVHQTPHYTDSGVMFVSVENIKTLQSNKFISLENFKSDFNVVPEKNDVLMTRIGDIGTANIVQSNEPLAYYVSLALLKSPSIDSFFFKSSIGCPDTKRELWKRTLHIAFPKKINKNEISLVGIKFPGTSEQKCIGNYFKQIDEMIAEAEREVSLLEKMKQASLQKMFPRPGAPAPEIRFDGFTEPWKEARLDSVASIFGRIGFRGYTVADIVPKDKGAISLSPTNLVGTNSVQYDTQTTYISNEKYLESPEIMVFPGDVVFVKTASVGRVAFIDHIICDTTLNPQLVVLKQLRCDGRFLSLSMATSEFQDKILGIAGGGVLKTLSQVKLGEQTLMFPSKLEQKAIGEYFRSLDSLLSAKRQKLVKLRNIKQACLDKMFVNTSEL